MFNRDWLDMVSNFHLLRALLFTPLIYYTRLMSLCLLMTDRVDEAREERRSNTTHFFNGYENQFLVEWKLVLDLRFYVFI